MLFNLRWSLNQVYNALPELFNDMQLPAGVNRETLIDTILMECGSMGCAYPIATMRRAIKIWSLRNAYTIEGIVKSTGFVYNPLDNYDRIEETTDKRDGTTGVITHSDHADNNNGKNNTRRAGYDSEEVKLDAVSDGEGHTVGESNGNTTSTDDYTNVRTSRIHGNIGVTSSDQLLTGYRASVKYSAYQEITDLFARELLIAIYF